MENGSTRQGSGVLSTAVIAGLFDPRPRIYELRAGGYEIVTASRLQQTESGFHHRVGAYLIRRGSNQHVLGSTTMHVTALKWVQLRLAELT